MVSGSSHRPRRALLIALPLISGVLLALCLFGVFFMSGGDWDFRFDGMKFLPWAGTAFLVGVVLGLGFSVAVTTWNDRRGCGLSALLICGIMWLLFFCGASLLIGSTFMY